MARPLFLNKKQVIGAALCEHQPEQLTAVDLESRLCCYWQTRSVCTEQQHVQKKALWKIQAIKSVQVSKLMLDSYFACGNLSLPFRSTLFDSEASRITEIKICWEKEEIQEKQPDHDLQIMQRTGEKECLRRRDKTMRKHMQI